MNAVLLARPTDPAYAWTLVLQGEPAAALEQANGVLCGPDRPTASHAVAESARLLAVTMLGDVDGSRRLTERILGGTDDACEDISLSVALTTLSHTAWRSGSVANAVALLRGAVRRADRSSAGVAQIHARLQMSATLTALGCFAESQDVLDQASAAVESSGERAWSAGVLAGRSALEFSSAHLDEARVTANASLFAAEVFGADLFVSAARRTLTSVALSSGKLPSAATQFSRLREAMDAGQVMPEDGASDVRLLESRLVAAQGEWAAAFEVARPLYDDLAGLSPVLLDEPTAAAWLTKLALAVDDRPRAEVVVRTAQLLASGSSFPSLEASAAHAFGVVAQDSAALHYAATEYRHPLARAAACEDAGCVLVNRNDAMNARISLQRALDVYRYAGADRDANRVEVALKRSKNRRRFRPVSGWSSLTDTERKVAEAVAEGLTNAVVAQRMYLSRHTVDFHLRQIFRKLEIRSRVELTRLLVEHQATH